MIMATPAHTQPKQHNLKTASDSSPLPPRQPYEHIRSGRRDERMERWQQRLQHLFNKQSY